MVGYKLSKNDWVTPFFVIFRSVREILLVTVFLEHPVVGVCGQEKNMAHQNHGLKMRQAFVLGTNVSLHLVSFLFFLIYFGVPSIEKYLEKKTIIVKESRDNSL